MPLAPEVCVALNALFCFAGAKFSGVSQNISILYIVSGSLQGFQSLREFPYGALWVTGFSVNADMGRYRARVEMSLGYIKRKCGW